MLKEIIVQKEIQSMRKRVKSLRKEEVELSKIGVKILFDIATAKLENDGEYQADRLFNLSRLRTSLYATRCHISVLEKKVWDAVNEKNRVAAAQNKLQQAARLEQSRKDKEAHKHKLLQEGSSLQEHTEKKRREHESYLLSNYGHCGDMHTVPS